MRGGRGITASARRRLLLGASAAQVPLLLSPPLCLFLPSASASGLLFLPALVGGRQAPAGKQEPPAEQRGRGAAAGCGRLLGVGRLLPAPGSRLQPVPAAWVCRVGLRLSPVWLVLALIRALPGFSGGEEMLARCSRPPRAARRSCCRALPDGGPASVGGSWDRLTRAVMELLKLRHCVLETRSSPAPGRQRMSSHRRRLPACWGSVLLAPLGAQEE